MNNLKYRITRELRSKIIHIVKAEPLIDSFIKLAIIRRAPF